MSRKFASVIMVTMLLISALTFSYKIDIVMAYKSGPNATHQFIFEQAGTILRNDGYVSYADFLDSVEPSSGLTYLQIMIKGSDDNDGLIAAREHYMDPMDHKGLLFVWYQKSAGTLAQERFEEALSRWQSGYYYDAMYNLGWAAHLVQDVCVPHHAWTTYLDWHDEYETWVNNNKNLYGVNSGGIYSFLAFPDLQYYTPKHYSSVNVSAYDWVDYNAHESIKHFLSVNSYTGSYVNDAADPYIETVHPLPNNLETTWIITTYGTTGMQLHFEKIDMETGFDYIRIYDKHDNLLATYTGQYGDFWTSWYSVGDTLKIKVTTDYSVQSWGYKIKEIKYYDIGEDIHGATSVLLSRAQRTTAGFIKFFFDKVLKPIYIRTDGSVDPSTAPIQRDGDIYTFTSNIYRSIVVEKDNIVIEGNGRTLQATYNVGDGFYLSGRNNVTIQNVAIKGFWNGIFVWNSTNITLSGNTLINNKHALRMYHSLENTIAYNTLANNIHYGIVMTNSSRNIIAHNNVTYNGRSAIYLVSSSDNKITYNKLIGNNWDGVWLSSSNNNTVTGNEVRINYWGIYLSNSFGNIIYHNNIINNTIQVYSYGATNIWDNGYPSGGNYWSDYTGVDFESGPNQDQPGGDGIGDTPYIIDANNIDNYPLMQPYRGPVRNLNNGNSYPTIQEGVNNASSGDRILVLSGIYYENIVVNKTVSLIGENKMTTIINGAGWNTVVITANHVKISDFTITGSGWWQSGLLLGGSNCSLFNNIIKDNYIGIMLEFSSNNTFKNNSLIGNARALSFLGQEELSDFINDIDASNFVDGKPIYYWVSRENDEVPSDAGYVALINSTNITVKDLNMSSGSILLAYTRNSVLTDNFITYNGIELIYSYNNTLISNTITLNWYGCGITLRYSFNNTITRNNITLNHRGISLSFSSNNRIYHNNFIDNWGYQVDSYGSANTWDLGYPSGGNYWSNYAGVDEKRGPTQSQPGSDGIGDTSYVIDESNQDRYPLMNPWPSIYEISIINITFSTASPKINDTICIYVTLQNNGHFTEIFDVSVNYTLMFDPLIGTYTVILAPDESITLNFTWTPTAAGRYEIKAYTNETFEDLIPENNTLITYVYVSTNYSASSFSDDTFTEIRLINRGFSYRAYTM